MDFFKLLFGEKGITGGVVDILKSAGVLKDTEAEQRAIQALRDYEIATQSAAIELEQIMAEDRADARAREIKAEDSWTPRVLAGLAIIGLILVFITVSSGFSPPEAVRDGFWMMVGAVIAIVKDVFGYYFGSSSGSKQKDRALWGRRGADE